MRHVALALSAAAVLAGMASPAFAQTAADTNDVRCLLVLQAVSRDPAQRDQASRGVFFYLGRLGARGPLARLEATMVAEGKKMNTPALLQTELGRCGGELNQRGGELQQLNLKLQREFGPPPGAAAPAPPAKK
jgi:hypothetical protein